MNLKFYKHNTVLLILVILCNLILTTCSRSPMTESEVEETPVSITPTVTQEDNRDTPPLKPTHASNRDTSPNVAENTLSELVNGNNAFAFDIYQAIRLEEGNLFFSPYSISIALAMTYAGARFATEQQMADVLHFNLPQEQLHSAFNALDLNLRKENNNDQEAVKNDFILNIANSIWAQEDFPFKPGYLKLIDLNYGAGLRYLNFKDQESREQARLIINDWTSKETEGKIKDLIQKDILTEFTRLVLTNAIYFKADWEDPFLHGTQDGDFTLLNGDHVMVPMMSRRADANYVEGAGYQAIELPYKGERMRMIILLPAEDQFEKIEGSLDKDFVDTLLTNLNRYDVKLYLPKFNYEYNLALAKILSDMGMPDPFDETRADFSGMADIPPRLFIAHVVHKAFVGVDEMGTEAAAATGVIEEIESMPIEVKINRPFIFFIHDKASGTILFIGRALDPSK